MSVARFNVLRDRWIPLVTDGGVRRASYGELLSGEAEGTDILHPRDDLRFYARMLLSALTQALFTPRTVEELAGHLAQPLSRAAVEARIDEVAEDFFLSGEDAFLQDALTETEENATPRLFLDVPSGSRHLLFRPAHAYSALCPSCAVMALYGIQAFAPQGGRGQSPGVRGSPPVTTLVWQPMLRASIWANVLCQQSIDALGLPPEHVARPWKQARMERTGDSLSLLEGLFWQPRAVRFVDDVAGTCDACGTDGPRVSARSFGAKSKVAGGFFRHPHTPAIRDTSPRAKRPWAPLHLKADRPAWVGLADLLGSVRGTDTGAGRQVLAAPVVAQWFEALDHQEVSLVLLSYSTDQAKIRARFSESFSFSMQGHGSDALADVRVLITQAEETLAALSNALRSANAKGNDRKADPGFWAADAQASFWQRTETPFWAALAQVQSGQPPSRDFPSSLQRTARDLFRSHTEGATLDGVHQERMAKAERQLLFKLNHLFPKEASHAA